MVLPQGIVSSWFIRWARWAGQASRLSWRGSGVPPVPPRWRKRWVLAARPRQGDQNREQRRDPVHQGYGCYSVTVGRPSGRTVPVSDTNYRGGLPRPAKVASSVPCPHWSDARPPEADDAANHRDKGPRDALDPGRFAPPAAGRPSRHGSDGWRGGQNALAPRH